MRAAPRRPRSVHSALLVCAAAWIRHCLYDMRLIHRHRTLYVTRSLPTQNGVYGTTYFVVICTRAPTPTHTVLAAILHVRRVCRFFRRNKRFNSANFYGPDAIAIPTPNSRNTHQASAAASTTTRDEWKGVIPFCVVSDAISPYYALLAQH